jgi:hypothetical protein
MDAPSYHARRRAPAVDPRRQLRDRDHSQTAGAFLYSEGEHTLALEQPQRPSTQTSVSTPKQSLLLPHSQRWVVVLHTETPLAAQSPLLAHWQRPVAVSHVDPRPALVQSSFVPHSAAEHVPAPQCPVGVPQTLAVPASPPPPPSNRGMTISCCPGKRQPKVGSGAEPQIPLPWTSTQMSPRQSPSLVQVRNQPLAKARQSASTLHADVGSKQIFFTGSHFDEVSPWTVQSSSVAHE